MTILAHHIRSCRLEVDLDDSRAALALRKQLRDSVESELLPALEGAFDALGLGTRSVHLRRLQLRVVVPQGKDVLAVLKDRLLDLIREEVSLEEAALALPSPSGHVASDHPSPEQALRVYLRQGKLPWFAVDPESPAILEDLRAAARRQLPTWSSDPRQLRNLAGPEANAVVFLLMRLLALLEDAERREFVFVLLDRGAAERAGRSWFTHSAVRTKLTGESTVVQACVLAVALAEPQALTAANRRATWACVPELFIQRALSYFPERADPTRAEIPSGAEPNLPLHPGSGNTAPAADSTPARGSRAPDPSETEATEAGTRSLPRSIGSATSATPARQELRSDGRSLRDGAREAPAAVRVHAAGLVLIHPYVARLFNECGLLDAERQLPFERRAKAAALLHWVATGRTEIQEFELGMIKTLLGMSISDPLVASAELLSDADRDEGDALLQAVVTHWRGLGSTRPDALREAFLQRPGLLVQRGTEGHQLTVEPKGYDVLLNLLPWGISLVKLPWMKLPIFTEWRTP